MKGAAVPHPELSSNPASRDAETLKVAIHRHLLLDYVLTLVEDIPEQLEERKLCKNTERESEWKLPHPNRCSLGRDDHLPTSNQRKRLSDGAHKLLNAPLTLSAVVQGSPWTLLTLACMPHTPSCHCSGSFGLHTVNVLHLGRGCLRMDVPSG